jgi:hypothetical protein
MGILYQARSPVVVASSSSSASGKRKDGNGKDEGDDDSGANAGTYSRQPLPSPVRMPFEASDGKALEMFENAAKKG